MSTDLSLRDRRRLARLALPLNLVLAGTGFVVLDLRVTAASGNRVASVDILPDWLGLVLIAIGFSLLAFGDRFKPRENLVVTGVATLYVGLATTAIGSWFFPGLELDPYGLLFLQAAGAAGLVAACWILRGFSGRLGLTRIAAAWKLAAVLFVVLWPLPTAVTIFDPALLAAPLFLVMAVLVQFAPVAAFLSATLQLRSVARRASPRESTHRGTI